MYYTKRSTYANGYSRSLNAQSAESDGRFPETRAAAALGISVKAFRAGCAAINYSTNEWHHVSKYANRVYYYDTDFLKSKKMFWSGAKNKSNAAFCEKSYWSAIKEKAAENTAEKSARFYEIKRVEKFRLAIGKFKNISRIEMAANSLRLNWTSEKPTQYTGNTYLKPFDITRENMLMLKKEYQRIKASRFECFSKSIAFMTAKKIVENIKNGRQFNADLSGLFYSREKKKGLAWAGKAMGQQVEIIGDYEFVKI